MSQRTQRGLGPRRTTGDSANSRLEACPTAWCPGLSLIQALPSLVSEPGIRLTPHTMRLTASYFYTLWRGKYIGFERTLEE